MTYTTLIPTADLAAHLDDPAWAIVDCRYDLVHIRQGEEQYRAAHIPGAVYADLLRDLSGPLTGTNGRHPLPGVAAFKRRLGEWGIGAGVQVAAYDQDTGMYASRLWWMLRYLGHEAVGVVDGGFARWTAEARPTRAGVERRASATFVGQPHPEMVVDADEVARLTTDPAYRLIDSRAPERYRGEIEPLDPVAGRIPGAVNHFNAWNIGPDGRLLGPEALRARFLRLLGGVPPANAVTYCGSGVAAAHNALALEVAGLPGARVYAGSWSEWCSHPDRPVARGEQAA